MTETVMPRLLAAGECGDSRLWAAAVDERGGDFVGVERAGETSGHGEDLIEIDEDQIGFFARVEGADEGVLAQRLCATEGREEDRFGRCERWSRLVMKGAGRLSFDRRTHDLPQVEFGARGNVGTEADRDSGAAEGVEGAEARVEEEIGGGAVSDPCAG